MSAVIDMYDDAIYNLNQEIIRLKLIEEQYIKLKEVMCPHEGLNIRFEYRVGDIKCGNARHITPESLHGYRVDAMIGYVYSSMWDEIEKYIESLKKDKS